MNGLCPLAPRYREALAELDAEDANQGYARVLDALGQAGWQRRSGWCWPASPRSRRASRACWTRSRPRARTSASGATQRAPAQPRRFEAPDQGSEWRAAASWAATQLQVHPTGRYAIVSPQLEAESVFARRVLGQALRRAALAFNVAVGRPLDEWPMARAAGLAARAGRMRGRQGLRRADAARCWPAIAPAMCERSRLSAIDARWRRDARQRVSAQEWRRQLSMTPVLAQAWNQAMDI